MKITVFTSNQPRHCSFIHDLSSIADEVYAIQECMTLFPGKVADFYKKSEIMQTYFSNVIAAEKEVFGDIRFSNKNVRTLPLKSDDLNMLSLESLKPALSSDVYVVFGASFIKGALIDFLVERKALNIHMGMSPYYRGASCNFWAMYDNNVNLVGATIHRLSKGLDSGAMLFHALPKPEAVDPFVLGMKSVRAAHKGLIENIRNRKVFEYEPVIQDKTQEIRYTRNAQFTDEIAQEYLDRRLTADSVKALFDQGRDYALTRPFYF